MCVILGHYIPQFAFNRVYESTSSPGNNLAALKMQAVDKHTLGSWYNRLSCDYVLIRAYLHSAGMFAYITF